MLAEGQGGHTHGLLGVGYQLGQAQPHALRDVLGQVVGPHHVVHHPVGVAEVAGQAQGVDAGGQLVVVHVGVQAPDVAKRVQLEQLPVNVRLKGGAVEPNAVPNQNDRPLQALAVAAWGARQREELIQGGRVGHVLVGQAVNA